MRQRTRARRWAVALATVALVAAACGGDDGGTGAEGGGEGGSTVNVLAAITEPGDVEGFNAMGDLFQQNTGNEVVLEGTPDFETTFITRVEGGNPPDVVLHPQPGILEQFAADGAARPLDFLDLEQLREQYVPGTLETGTFGGTLYGLQTDVSLKSLVWYPTPEFNEGGYEIPENWQQMLDVSGQIAQQSGETLQAPWCIGVEASGSTGWPATDWIEDIVLRLHGPEVYDQWVQHEILFDSPEITEAFEMMGNVWFQENWVLGGRTNILQTNFNSAPLPLFEQPPGCFMHRQASFIQQSFPDDVEFGTDYDFFLLPPIEDGGTGDQAAVLGGNLAAIYTDNPAAEEFIQFLSTPEAQSEWANLGTSIICANTGCDPEVYNNDAFRDQAELLTQVDITRFDGSDLMPGAVGAGAFWTEVVAWISEQQDLQTTLQNIDAAWPEDTAGFDDTGTGSTGTATTATTGTTGTASTGTTGTASTDTATTGTATTGTATGS